MFSYNYDVYYGFGGSTLITLKVLSKEGIEKIHFATLDVLEKTGIKFDDKKALEIFDENGAKVNYRSKVVKIPESLIKEAIRKCPRKIKLYARNRKYNLEIGTGKSYVHTPEGAYFVEDLSTGEIREATIKDVENFAKLGSTLENIHVYIPLVNPQDVPLEIRDIYRNKISLENIEKHFIVCAHSYEGMVYTIKMASAIVGGLDELVKKPIITGDGGAVSPLTSSKHNLRILRYCANLGLPCSIGSAPMAGGTAPASLAGTLVIQNAENLAWITLAQLINPGLPIISLVRAFILDLRKGDFAAGAPEAVLMSVALIQLYKYYGIPVDAGWSVSDSKFLDVQVGYDKVPMMLMSVLAGADFISGFGLIDSGITASYSQLVIDNEAFSMVSRISQGITIDDEGLALDLIDKVGPGGNFLGERHTIKCITSRREHFFPTLFSRGKEVSEDIVQRARKMASKLISSSQAEPLPADVQKDLNNILEEAKKSLLRRYT